MAADGWRRLPPGIGVPLPGRGTVSCRVADGPPGAPAVVLVHGVAVSADLNWFGAFEPLARQFRVLAPDLPGHGRAPEAPRFTLADCADGVAALVRELGLGPVVVAGYSMGGLVAQLVARRHPDAVRGLVLAATARNFLGTPLERLLSMSLPTIALATRLNPLARMLDGTALAGYFLDGIEDRALAHWARAEMARTSLATVTAAFDEVCRFTSHTWVHELPVPVAVVVTGRDRVVPPARQRRLAAAAPGCSVHELDGGHPVFVTDPDRFAATLLDACRRVAAPGSGSGLPDGERRGG